MGLMDTLKQGVARFAAEKGIPGGRAALANLTQTQQAQAAGPAPKAPQPKPDSAVESGVNALKGRTRAQQIKDAGLDD